MPRFALRTAPAIALILLLSCSSTPEPVLSGELQVWHRLTLAFEGPDTAEDATPNPFRDYRLDVTFTHTDSGDSLTVPGYYAADGDAANTSATAGNIWKAHFSPTQSGTYTWQASFRTGTDVAIADDATAGEPASFDGASGSFGIQPSGKSGADFRAKGRLDYIGGHHLRHAGNGEYFLKGGADSPENFLAYHEFDNTYDTEARFNEGTNKKGKFIHEYTPHIADYKPGGEPLWAGGKGKGIIGALHYLASKGMNSVYFLTYNIDGGDGKDIWMWSAEDVRDRFDCSKLDQWEIVFSHMTRLGIMLHVITQETENDHALGGGPGLNPERRLYYRELIARFAHHPALVWNQGEENNVSAPDRKAIANFIRALDPYDHPITVHSHNNKAREDYAEILGAENFEVTSIQGKMENYNDDAIYFRKASAAAGRPWAIFGDEQPPATHGVVPDADDPTHDIPRKYGVWGNLMGGGSGVEWYFGYEFPNMDLNCEDWRSRDKLWDLTRHGLTFFREHLPFWEMEPANDLARGGKEVRVLAKPNEVYAVYLTNGGTTSLNIGPGTYTVKWYNPRTGGPLQTGSVETVTGPAPRPLGLPPSDPTTDWAVLVK